MTKTITHKVVHEDGKTTPAKTRVVEYEGERERFDDAFDQLQEALARCRAEHPQARIDDATVYGTPAGTSPNDQSIRPRFYWSLSGEEPA